MQQNWIKKNDKYGKELLPERFLPKDFADYKNSNFEEYLNDGIELGALTLIEADPMLGPPPSHPPPEMEQVTAPSKQDPDGSHPSQTEHVTPH